MAPRVEARAPPPPFAAAAQSQGDAQAIPRHRRRFPPRSGSPGPPVPHCHRQPALPARHEDTIGPRRQVPKGQGIALLEVGFDAIVARRSVDHKMSLNGRIQQLTISSKHPNETQQLFCLLRNVQTVWRRCLRSLAGTIFLAPFCRLCRAVREGRSVHGMNASKLYVQARIQPASCTPSGHITRFHHTLQCILTACVSR